MTTYVFLEVYVSFCFIILNVRTKGPKVLNNRKMGFHKNKNEMLKIKYNKIK